MKATPRAVWSQPGFLVLRLHDQQQAGDMELGTGLHYLKSFLSIDISRLGTPQINLPFLGFAPVRNLDINVITAPFNLTIMHPCADRIDKIQELN